jgi:hypothetical protein
MSMNCSFHFNYDWITKEPTFDWLLPLDQYEGPQGPWWQCINCDEIFFSATLCNS